MEESDLKCRPPYRVLTFRDGQQVIFEDVETEIAAKVRFASAIDLCKAHDAAHAHRVELRSGDDVLDVWQGGGA